MLYSQREGENNLSADRKIHDINSQIIRYLHLSTEVVNRNPDSAILYAEHANKLINSVTSEISKVEIYKNLGDFYGNKGNYPLALQYFIDAKKIADNLLDKEPGDTLTFRNYIDLNIRIGVIFYYQKKYDQALQYYDDALEALGRSRFTSSGLVPKYKLKILNNIAAIYIQKNEYDRALEYYITALKENTGVGDDQIEASFLNNIGICYMEKKEFSLANHYFHKALNIREKLGDKRGIAQVYNNLGKNYVYNGNFTEASNYFQIALKLGRELGNKESMIVSLQSLSNIYDTLKMYKNALTAYKEYEAINDSLFNIENVQRIAQLETQYKFEKQQKLFDLELRRREAESEKIKLIYLIVGGTLFFLLMTSVLLIYLQRSKIKNSLLLRQKLDLEHNQIILEKQKLEKELEFKNRELTTNVMYLLRKNEMITGISEKLIKSKFDFKSENQKIIQEIISELKAGQDKDVWSEFEAHFTQVHFDFYKRLNELFPGLSANEKKLCAFLRLNMSTKEISAITYQSVNSIIVARSRLRKKLNIQGEDVNLVNFLMQL